jgi:hypothetical protein
LASKAGPAGSRGENDNVDDRTPNVPTTNEPTIPIDQIRSALAAGGFDVISSTELDESVHEYTVQYQAGAEAAARDVANRLASVLGTMPTVKKSQLTSEFDIIVWMPRR